MAFDAEDNLWVADTFNHRIQKLTAAGGNDVFSDSQDLAIDGAGNIWVADRLGRKVVKFDSNGVRLLTVDTGFDIQLFRPISSPSTASTTSPSASEGGTVATFTSDGQFLTKLGVTGSAHGLAFDSHDNLYVAASTQND